MPQAAKPASEQHAHAPSTHAAGLEPAYQDTSSPEPQCKQTDAAAQIDEVAGRAALIGTCPVAGDACLMFPKDKGDVQSLSMIATLSVARSHH
jgi:hypothetical protein